MQIVVSMWKMIICIQHLIIKCSFVVLHMLICIQCGLLKNNNDSLGPVLFCSDLNSDRTYSSTKWWTTKNVVNKFLSMISDNFESSLWFTIYSCVFRFKNYLWNPFSLLDSITISLSLSHRLFLVYMYTNFNSLI